MDAQKYLRGLFLAAPVALAVPGTALAQQEPCIGNSAAITGPAAFGGQAIKMGAEIAIDEINAKGVCSASRCASSSTTMPEHRRAASTIPGASRWPTSAWSSWVDTTPPFP